MGAESSKLIGPRVIKLPAERDGESEIIRSIHTSKDNKLIERLDDNICTLFDIFSISAKKYPDNKCLGWRVGEEPYRWLTYKESFERAQNFGAGLVHLGFTPHKDMLGIYSINRVEWVLTEEGCNAYSFCIVPLYDTLGPEACAFIINQTELAVIVCSSDKVKGLLNAAHSIRSLKTIIYFDNLGDDLKELALSKNIQLFPFEYVEASGKENLIEPQPPAPEELSTICYTSGTTGDPKGVTITHANIVADMSGGILNGINAFPTDIHISYLPLAHVLERLLVTGMINGGGAIGFFRGDVRKLFDDILELKPTIFGSVPRLFNRLYDKVMAAVNESGQVQQLLFQNAYEAKRAALADGYITHSAWDPLVFNSIRSRLGGNVRIMITGSAPISEKIIEFLRICFSTPVVEGYGQTETSSAATTTLPSDTDSGHVGVPIASIEIKLVDVPDMNYFSTDLPYPRGEICFRGPCVAIGYYKNKEKTDETWDQYGWLHSGDIGTIDAAGNIHIIDRRKNIFKLAQGEYIAPEKIENIYVQSKYILQCWVYGDSLKSQCIAIIVPDHDTVKVWAQEKGLPPDDLQALCNSPELVKTILEDMEVKGKQGGLKGFEVVKTIHLVPVPFSVEDDLLTPTFKIKRQQARQRFQKEIEEMYKDIE